MRQFALLILILVNFACTEEAQLDFEFSKDLVVNVFFTPGKELTFSPRFSTELYAEEEGTVPSDLNFLFSEEGQCVDTITFSEERGVYYSEATIQPGKHYALDCVYANTELHAESTVPGAIFVRNVNVTPLSYRNSKDIPYNQVVLEIPDEPGNDYYMIYVKCQTYFNQAYFRSTFKDSLYEDLVMHSHLRSTDPVILAESYFPHTIQDEHKTFPYLVFSDKLFDSDIYKFQFFYESPLFKGGAGVFMYDHVPEIYILRFHAPLYEYLSSYIQHMQNRQGNILSGRLDPLNVKGNIENGLGIFSGYTQSVDSSLFFARMDIETGSIIMP